MSNVQKFLAKNGLQPETINPETLLGLFETEMARGLDGDKNALPMIPAFVTIERAVPVDKPVAVIDAGGTNLRVATVRFDSHGRSHIENYSRHPMPGTQGELSADAFFGTLADLVAPVAARTEAIGFCFSYQAEVTPDRDARLRCWTKQVKAPEVVGRMIGGELRERLQRRGLERRVTVLNDTVATLLAGKSANAKQRYGSYVGLILGTGTNTAYIERNANIHKRTDLDPKDAMAINVESGSFSKAPRSRFDEIFDAIHADAGEYKFEKMISGAYLGGLGGTILREAAKAGLFSAAAAPGFTKLPLVETKDLDAFCQQPFQPPAIFAAIPMTDDDRRTALALCMPVYTRAALYAAVNIAAAVIRTGSGSDPLYPVAVTIDGSTYYRTKTAAFASRIQAHLRAILEPRGLHFDLLHVDEAPIIGAAVAGLTN
jgi:hexokinase